MFSPLKRNKDLKEQFEINHILIILIIIININARNMTKILLRLFSNYFLFRFNVQYGYQRLENPVCVGVEFLAFNVLLHTKSEKK